MRPLLRTAVTGMAVLAVVAGVATGVMQPASASPESTPTPSVAPTPTLAPVPDATPAPTATPTSPPAPAPSPTASPSTAPAVPQADPVTADPSLATMNAAGNHSMGSTVEQFEGAPAPKASARMAAPLAATAAAGTPPGVPGLDVSGWQVLNSANWATIRANGARFAYVKATEATDYTSSQFSEQYNDSYAAGLAHGAYHFATPNTSSGAAQANWFMAHGGAGTNDGRTMPPLLDIEYNPYGATCYGLSQAAMVSWIHDFINTIHARIGRWAAIYSTTNWWSACTGNSNQFAANPLFIARYPNSISDGAGTLPASWSSYTLWQYADSGVFPGDQDVFNGSGAGLTAYALGSSLVRTVSNASVYLISGSNKYPVPSAGVLTALSPMGKVAYVSQAFLDTLATQQVVTRILRSPGGTIYFVDSGLKLPFNSCAQVADYGGSCDTSGYAQVSDGQIASYVTGAAVGPVINTISAGSYYISGGKRHQILDSASLTAAAVPASPANRLSNESVAYLPFGAPIARDSVYVAQTGTSAYYLLAGGLKHAVDPGTVALAGSAARTAGSLQAGSLAVIPSSSAPFTGVMQVSGNPTISVLGTGGAYTWAQGVGGAAFGPVTVSQAFLNSYAAKGSIAPGSAIKSAADATVYLTMPTQVLPVGAWDSLIALSGGKTPTIVTIPQKVIASLKFGPVALTAGALVRTPQDATVYLVNGVTNKVAFSDLVYPNQAGITKLTFTTQTRLDAYPTGPARLVFGITCGSQSYVSAAGSVHAIGASLLPLYPITFVPLDTFTCALLHKGTAATSFIRTPNGSIYYLDAGKKRPITSLARFQQLSGGKGYLNVTQKFANLIPTGAKA
ncbi:lysozyme [Diaminobutyricibacter sp. McL0608]|uniref:lysozyme n=1 Tax=Leifsonia sp. McL0608 TaxID=3143537 RepID=UPI0031F32FFD